MCFFERVCWAYSCFRECWCSCGLCFVVFGLFVLLFCAVTLAFGNSYGLWGKVNLVFLLFSASGVGLLVRLGFALF